MIGLTTGEMAIAMVEIGLGKDARTTSIGLKDPEKLLAFERLEAEMKEIAASGGMIDLGSDWLGKE
jgi:hypothetical protein